MQAPSSSRDRELGGMEPGEIPPMSAWCPRESHPENDLAVSEHGRDHRDVRQMAPPGRRMVGDQDIARGKVALPQTNLLLDRVAHGTPGWTGRCGALATSSPSGPKRAQEKSRRSLMLVGNGGFLQHAAHLLGYGHEQVAENGQLNGVHALARLFPFRTSDSDFDIAGSRDGCDAVRFHHDGGGRRGSGWRGLRPHVPKTVFPDRRWPCPSNPPSK